jgi:transcriptional regulator with XRE-family HTH domain
MIVIMKLRDYLDKTSTSQAQFAQAIGVTQQAVSGWVFNGKTPRRGVLARIVRETKGAVTANDFMGAPSAPFAEPQEQAAAQ